MQTPPSRKLPALYVLDSVVKNVGTPYTLFLGRNLFSTFMNAYTLVDAPVRAKLKEMLKTWKEPVPGSMDQRPVFPVETTRPIDNALLKAQTAFLANMSRQKQAATPNPQWRGNPIPPQLNGRYNPQTQQVYTQHNVSNGHFHVCWPLMLVL